MIRLVHPNPDLNPIWYQTLSFLIGYTLIEKSNLANKLVLSQEKQVTPKTDKAIRYQYSRQQSSSPNSHKITSAKDKADIN